MAGKTNIKKMTKKERRGRRTRAKLFGTAERPRLSVFKSNSHIYAQLINDEKGVTLAASSDTVLATQKTVALKERALHVGMDIAKKAAQKKIQKAVFDRGSFSYTGVIRSLADGARKGGLAF